MLQCCKCVITGFLEWTQKDSGQEELPLFWNAWGSAWGQVMSQLTVYGSGVEVKLKQVMLMSATGHLTGKNYVRLSKNWKKPSICRLWSSLRPSLISAGGTAQKGTCNSRDFLGCIITSWHRLPRNQGDEEEVLLVLTLKTQKDCSMTIGSCFGCSFPWGNIQDMEAGAGDPAGV